MFNSTKILVIATLVVIVAGVGVHQYSNKPAEPIQKACTMEAKICSDGTSVGRTAPNCEFANCPVENIVPTTSSGIKGTVLLGPTCPVLRNPPDPQCADKPYQTALSLTTPDGLKVLQYFSSDSTGKFSIDVSPGNYMIRQTVGIASYPRCRSTGIISVQANTYTQSTVYCDTGIR